MNLKVLASIIAQVFTEPVKSFLTVIRIKK